MKASVRFDEKIREWIKDRLTNNDRLEACMKFKKDSRTIDSYFLKGALQRTNEEVLYYLLKVAKRNERKINKMQKEINSIK